MGIGIHGARSLIVARRRGVSFERTLTLGCQDLAVPYPVIEKLFRSLQCSPAAPPGLTPNDPRWHHAEPFFELLGATQVDTLDASSFEWANVIHDLNRPVPEELWGRFDVVFDGGTIEHVFHFPTAIQSCMRMVRTGGRVIIHTPGNNWFGHGFYQFSPELFFRVFSEDNGFAVEAMNLVENFPPGRCYSMVDPAPVGQRAETFSVLPILIMVEAVKQREVPNLLESPPIQSDYAAQWHSGLRSLRRGAASAEEGFPGGSTAGKPPCCTGERRYERFEKANAEGSNGKAPSTRGSTADMLGWVEWFERRCELEDRGEKARRSPMWSGGSLS